MNWDRCEEDFEFVFGDHEVCRVHSVLAEFLSPKIALMRKNDPFCSFYVFSSASSKYFSAFESLVACVRGGRAIEVNEDNYEAIFQILLELCSFEGGALVHYVNETLDGIEARLLCFKRAVDVGVPDWTPIKVAIDYLAEHFYEIDKDILDELDPETLEYLLSNPSLRIADEDSLYSFVKSRAERDERFMTLFEHVWFEYLSVENVQDFLSFIIRHLDDFLTAAKKTMIISALVKQLLQTRREEAVQHYDYEALKKQRDENGLIFEEETIPNNKNIVCYKEIRNQERVLYRCFVMQGSADERNACIDFINLKMREIYTSLQDPMSPFWFSEELRLWICYITGFSWDELTNRNRPQDRETLVATRHSICSIMKEQIHPYVQLFLQQLSSMVEDINNTSEKENKRSLFAFMGVTHEVIVEKTTENMSFLERVKRIL